LSDDGGGDDDDDEYTYYLNLSCLFLLNFHHSVHVSMLKTIITETFFSTTNCGPNHRC